MIGARDFAVMVERGAAGEIGGGRERTGRRGREADQRQRRRGKGDLAATPPATTRASIAAKRAASAYCWRKRNR